MSQVRVFDLRKRNGSKNPWQVRWRVRGRDHSRQFPTRASADTFRARLVTVRDQDASGPAGLARLEPQKSKRSGSPSGT